MKKFLLSLFASVAICFGVMAETTTNSVVFDFTTPSTLGDYSDEGQSQDEVTLTGLTFTINPVSIYFSAPETASTQPRLYYGTGGAAGWTFRFYKDSEITVSVPEGKFLTSIVFDGTNLGKDWSYSTGTFDTDTWTPTDPTDTVTFGKTATGNNPTIKTLTVYYSDDTSTGISSVENTIPTLEYYNLQGVKVTDPSPGIYIIRRSNTTTKQVIR